MSDTTTTISGNLTRDPELRFTSSGTAVADLGVAVNNRFQVNGEWSTEVSYHTVVAWKGLGENAAASLKKGDRVTVTGRMRQRSYTTAAGDNRVVWELIATEIGASLRFAQVAIEKVAGATAKADAQGPFEGAPTDEDAPTEEMAA